MSRIRAILFDKDGTLLDFNRTWLSFIKQFVYEAAGGVEARSRELLELVGFNAEAGVFRAGSAMAAGTSADIVKILYPNLSGDGLAAMVAKADRRAADVARHSAVPLDGAVEAVQRLHGLGYRLGIATNDATLGAENTLAAFGIDHLFDAVYGYDAVTSPKPAPDVVYAFAGLLEIKPSEIAFVGDNLHDIMTARAASAGLAVGVSSGTGAAEDLACHADIVLASVADLPDYLMRA